MRGVILTLIAFLATLSVYAQNAADTLSSPVQSRWDDLKEVLTVNRDVPEATQMLAIIGSNMSDTAKESAILRCKLGLEYLKARNLYTLPDSIAVKYEAVYVPGTPTSEPTIVYQLKEPDTKKSLLVGAKTNLFYDLVAVPALGLEFYLGKNWSLVANWMYSWWKSDPKAWYWRTYGGDIAVRKWFGKASHKKPLSGHHVGPYGQIITYDFLIDDDGILADKWSYAVGLEYGYSVPLGRRLNMDFTLGAGYHWGEFKEYVPLDGHYVWQATKRRHYIGPTKIEISLVWLIGGGDKIPAKGGKR